MFCNNNRVCWVIFPFIQLLHSKHLSSFLQNFSIRSFRCGKQQHRTGAHYPEPPYQLFPRVNPVLYLLFSFYLFFIFYFFFSIMFSSSKLQYSRLYFPFIDEVTEICIKSKFSEKCSNTDRRVGAKLYRLNLTAVNHSIL